MRLWNIIYFALLSLLNFSKMLLVKIYVRINTLKEKNNKTKCCYKKKKTKNFPAGNKPLPLVLCISLWTSLFPQLLGQNTTATANMQVLQAASPVRPQPICKPQPSCRLLLQCRLSRQKSPFWPHYITGLLSFSQWLGYVCTSENPYENTLTLGGKIVNTSGHVGRFCF